MCVFDTFTQHNANVWVTMMQNIVDCNCLTLYTQLQRQYTAKDLFQMVTPLVRSEGEVGEVVVTALGLVNPDAF